MIIENKLYAPFKNYNSNLISSNYYDVSSIRGNKVHKGTDFAIPSGTEILAPEKGVVLRSEITQGTCGGLIEIKHPDNIVTKYCHLKKLFVKPNENVVPGQIIALSGGDLNDLGRGHTTGAHLHFEVRRNGVLIDPETVLSNETPPTPNIKNKNYLNKMGDFNPVDLNKMGDFNAVDLNKMDDFNAVDLNKNESVISHSFKNKKLNLKDIYTLILNEEESDDSDSITSIGNKIRSSFKPNGGTFEDAYTYHPSSGKFYCKFSKCKVLSSDDGICKKVEVEFESKTYIINVCCDKFNLNEKNTNFDELIGEVPRNSEYFEVYVSLGGVANIIKVKLIDVYGAKNTPKKNNRWRSSSGGGVASYSTLPTTNKSNSYIEPYDLPTTNKSNSYTEPYELPTTSKSKSYTTPYDLPITNKSNSYVEFKLESKSASKKLITEINRILEIL